MSGSSGFLPKRDAARELRQRRRLCGGGPEPRLAARTTTETSMGPIGRAALGICVAALMSAPALAQEKVWRHGIIEAKSDSGIFYMASKRDFAQKLGLKLEFVPMQTDTIELKA